MIEYRTMRDSDVTAIAEIEKLCFSDPWSENSVRYELTNPLSLWYVALCDGDVVGYVGSQSVMDEADMMNIAVHPAHRRKGVAQMLICQLIAGLAVKDVRCLTLEVRASNDPAIALYEKMDFKAVGRRPNYYRNPKEDALIMRKEWDA